MSDEKYTELLLASGELVYLRKPIKDLAAELDPAVFWRTHRSALVNTRHLRGARKLGDGDLGVQMKIGEKTIPVSRAYEKQFRRLTQLSE
jgi:DNA-binding LytR/AlgR family response regulator